MNEDKATVGEKNPAPAGPPHKHVTEAVAVIGMCAFGAFVLGALLGAPWPGAVAACGLAIMGVGVASVMMRRG